MKFERNISSKKYFLCGLILVVVLTVTVTFITSKANYRMTASIPLTEGKVVASPYDIKVMAMYINEDNSYKELDKTTTIPDGYKINEEESYCYKESRSNKDTNAKLYTDELGNHVISGISKSSKCILYLDKTNDNCGIACKYILSNINNINIRRKDYLPFNEVITGENAPTEKTIYKAYDDDGTSYYFAGNPTDNWVEFGGYYWRIIRINGNGSIRLIYQGRIQDENGSKLEAQATGTETQIGTSAFNTNYNDNKYVGYKYDNNETASNVYTTLNTWFANSNIKQGTSYFDKIDLNTGFCGDRTLYSTTSGGAPATDSGIGTTATFYGALIRLRPGNVEVSKDTPTVTPSFKCTNKVNDLYTYSNANQGNKALANPVGLIVADEVSYAGMIVKWSSITTNIKTNYLYTGQNYWTISPCWYGDYNAYVYAVRLDGYLSHPEVVTKNVVRPVINLRSDITLTGDGTQSNPYKIID